MAIDLDATLDAVLDSTTRRPLISLVSSEGGAEIPFSGNDYKSEPAQSINPSILAHSNGRLYTVHAGASGDLYLFVTDADREEWEEIKVVDAGSWTVLIDTSSCELDSGQIGIVYTKYVWLSQTIYLYSCIIDEDGNVVAGPTLLETISDTDDEWFYHPAVVNMSNGTQMIVVSRVDKTADPKESVLYKYTATNFINWSSATAISVGGLDSPQHEIQNVSLIEDNNNNILLWFDYVDEINDQNANLFNIYMSMSDDFGSTWASVIGISDYDTFAETGMHPEACQRSNDNMVMVYTRLLGSQYIDQSADNWPTTYGSWCAIGGILGSVEHVEYDASTNRLLVRCVSGMYGTKAMCAIVVIDIDTWSVYRSYTGISTPGYNNLFANSHVWWDIHNIDPPYIPYAVSNGMFAGCIDYVSDTNKGYYFSTSGAYGITEVNMTHVPPGNIEATWVDANTDRMYILWTGGYAYPDNESRLTLGYIDLTETADVVTGMYTWHNIVTDSGYLNGIGQISGADYWFSVWPDDNLIVVTAGNKYVHSTGWQGAMWIYTMDGGAFKKYSYDTHSGFHKGGVGNHCLQNGKIYGQIFYTDLYLQQDRRGIMEVDYFTDTFKYWRPSHATKDDYGIGQMKPINSTEVLMCSSSRSDGGVLIFNSADQSWLVYNRTHSGDDSEHGVSGFDPAGTGQYTADTMHSIAYDPNTGIIYSGRIYTHSGTLYSQNYVLMFSRYGTLNQPYYVNGVYSGGVWDFDFDNRELWIRGYYNDGADVAVVDSSIWTTWEDVETEDAEFLLWDREGEVMDLSDLVPAGTEVVVRWALEEPNSLTFQLAKGHLFDQHNLSSVYSPLLKKGRTITVQFGENIDGLPYWVDQGEFLVHESKISIEKGSDPIIEVLCYDKTIMWQEMLITATRYFDGRTPREILIELGETFLDLHTTEMDWPNFDDSHALYHQWIDMTFKDIVDEICHHWGYVPKFNKAGLLTALKVTNTNPVDNTYSDRTTTVNYTPDDTYSNYLNRITVIGETHDFLEVVFTEERILNDAGTIGMWKQDDTNRYYYSDDRDRRCIQPQLANVHKPTMINLFWEDESDINITYEDPYNYYCEITIESPDWEQGAIVLIAELAVTALVCKFCDSVSSIPIIGTIFGGCGTCIFMITLMLVQMLQYLTSTSHWSFDLYAKPMGQEKQTVQFTVNDTEFQQKLGGIVVEERIEDSMCYSTNECERVARYEMMIVQQQRMRLTLTKLAHLQDELGDTIQFVHPYSQSNIRMFITALTRRYTQGHPGEDEGYFFDDLEGWRI